MTALGSNMIDRARAVPIASVIEAHGIKLRGRVDRSGPCPVCGGVDRFAINTRKQVFLCRQCGGKGDAIALTQLLDGCDFQTAVATLAGETTIRRGSQIRPPEPLRKDDDRDQKVASALALWGAAVDPRGTLVEEYLKGRCLSFDDDVAGHVLRWHSGIGAMVALFRNIETDEPQAISRTFIDKAGRKTARKFLGRVAGAAVKLDADVTTGLFIAEGIETAMTGRQLGLRPSWALGSCIAIAHFPVVPGIGTLSMLRERDDANDRASNTCGSRWLDAGREVYDVWPDIGSKDLNDELMMTAGRVQ